ncbi:MAG: hypothetical protein HY796_08460, partial [Elusimicrobia bacterium]|nr:hypothetical protein [Elusimicrobiota bacterium]
IRFQKKDPSSNGCGGGALGAIAHTLAKMGVKNIDDPAGAGITSFKSNCDLHDERYDTCKDVYEFDKDYKESWDAEFLKNMELSCGNAQNEATKKSCLWWANYYAKEVRKDTNYKFYEAAQLKKCRCCDIK